MTGRNAAAGRVGAVLLCAGSSSRLGVDKLWVDLQGQPLLAWSLAAFKAAALVDRIALVTTPDAVQRVQDLVTLMRLRAVVVPGGARRRDSVRAGLEAVADCEWVVVHDGARPFVTPEMICEGVEAARLTGAAIAAVPVTDTVKMVYQGTVATTLDRAALWAAQTPQVFRVALLREAHLATPDDATDDAALVEALGIMVRVFPGAYGNMKVTHPDDLPLARALAAERGFPTADSRLLAGTTQVDARGENGI